MEEKKTENKEEDAKKSSNKFVDKATKTFQWWNKLATLNANDPIALGVFKIGIRIIGIIILILLSPFVIISIIVGFMAAL